MVVSLNSKLESNKEGKEKKRSLPMPAILSSGVPRTRKVDIRLPGRGNSNSNSFDISGPCCRKNRRTEYHSIPLHTTRHHTVPLYAREREFFIDNLLVRTQVITWMILVDRPCAMGV